MIGFCEDCGAKNGLPDEAVLNGTARFRCSVCGYPNAYALAANPEVPKQLSEIIQPCPEIMAAFVVDAANASVILRLPDSLKPQDLDPLGLHLAKSLVAVSSLFPDVRGQRVCIGDKHLTVLRAARPAFLFLSQRSLNCPPVSWLPFKPC